MSVEPEGQGPFTPGSTANVKVTTSDKSGKPVAGRAIAGRGGRGHLRHRRRERPGLFDTFWSERGLGVRTSTSFTSGETSEHTATVAAVAACAVLRGEPMPSAAAPPRAGGRRQ